MENITTTNPAETSSSAENTGPDFDASFQTLLNSWNTHHANRTAGATLTELHASRTELDANRLTARLSLAS